MKVKMTSAQEVYDFWFNEGNEEKWFQSTDEFDEEIRTRFMRHGMQGDKAYFLNGAKHLKVE